MTKKPSPTQLSPVVIAVFTGFVKRLELDPAIDPIVTKRISDVLLVRQDISIDALKSALFAEEVLP